MLSARMCGPVCQWRTRCLSSRLSLRVHIDAYMDGLDLHTHGWKDG